MKTCIYRLSVDPAVCQTIWGVSVEVKHVDSSEVEAMRDAGWCRTINELQGNAKNTVKVEHKNESLEFTDVSDNAPVTKKEFESFSVAELRELASDYGIDPEAHHSTLKKEMRKKMLGKN